MVTTRDSNIRATPLYVLRPITRNNQFSTFNLVELLKGKKEKRKKNRKKKERKKELKKRVPHKFPFGRTDFIFTN